MIKTRTVLFSLFFLLVVSSGVYRYVVSGVYNEYSQWDLRSHTAAIYRTLGISPDPYDSAFQQRAYLPPYLPIAYPLFHFLGRLNWRFAKTFWLFLSILLVGMMLFIVFRQIRANGKRIPKYWQVMLAVLIFLFGGTFLGLAAGQLSIPVIFLLMVSVCSEEKNEILAGLCLALATLKPNLALPFFVYFLQAAKYRIFVIGFFSAIIINAVVSFFYLGPAGHFVQLFESLLQFESAGSNSYLLLGGSGRVDLAPFLAVWGIKGLGLWILLGIILLGGLVLLYRYRRGMPATLLLLNVNSLFFIVTYHRGYDLLLLILLALPLIWGFRQYIQSWLIIAVMPLALPVQKIYFYGIRHLPAAELFFNLVGTSVVISVIIITIYLNRFQLFRERNNF